MKKPSLWSRLLRWMVRSTLANQDQWLVDWFGGGNLADSGITVNETLALNLSTVFSAVSLLAEAGGSLPLILYRRQDDNKERAMGHHLYSLLHDQPNSLMSSMSYREAAIGHLGTWGNHYSEIERNNKGEIIGLWPLRPDRMTVRRPVYNRLEYDYQDAAKPLSQEKVLHIRGFGFDGLIGYNPIRLSKDAIGLGLAAQKYASKFFAGGGAHRVALKHPQQLNKKAKENIRESWGEVYGGIDKAHLAAVLDEGMDVVTIGVDPQSAQMLATREFQVREIARIYKIPPHFLGATDTTSYASIEQEMLRFLQHTLRPWLKRIEQDLNRTLLKPEERREYFFEHLVDDILRADIKTRFEAYAKGIQWGILSPDQAATKENLPTQGGNSAKKWMPVNLAPMDERPAPKATKGGQNAGV